LIESYLSELHSTLNDQYDNVLVHGDLSDEKNILWNDDNTRIKVIDFSDRVYDDPAIDFSWLFTISSSFPKQVLDLYTGKKDSRLLYRAHLYFKKIPLWIMKEAVHGMPYKFEQGYKMFKERFV
jgi:aminoglycoside phosphotransferase (APT) family kinase protein